MYPGHGTDDPTVMPVMSVGRVRHAEKKRWSGRICRPHIAGQPQMDLESLDVTAGDNSEVASWRLLHLEGELSTGCT